jgi:hypothetical protein
VETSLLERRTAPSATEAARTYHGIPNLGVCISRSPTTGRPSMTVVRVIRSLMLTVVRGEDTMSFLVRGPGGPAET